MKKLFKKLMSWLFKKPIKKAPNQLLPKGSVIRFSAVQFGKVASIPMGCFSYKENSILTIPTDTFLIHWGETHDKIYFKCKRYHAAMGGEVDDDFIIFFEKMVFLTIPYKKTNE